MPVPVAQGFGYDDADQSVLVELWVEKSTQNDILIPLCQRLHVNLLVGTGFESIGAALDALRRGERWDKPVHFLYVSDYDRARRAMPCQISRQLQFWAEESGLPLPRFTVEPLVLTREQCIEYDLPPMFDRDERGAVELDALEGQHPGKLAEIVEDAVTGLRDIQPGIQAKYCAARGAGRRRRYLGR